MTFQIKGVLKPTQFNQPDPRKPGEMTVVQGVMRGYVVEFAIGDQKYRVECEDGIRGTSGCTVTLNDDNVFIEL